MKIYLKKTLSYIVTVSIALGCHSAIFAQTTSGTEPAMYGDADNDKQITVSDALMVLKSVVKLITPDEYTKKIMDVDADGQITVSDALCILKYVVKLIDHFDAETTEPSSMPTEAPTGTPTETPVPEPTETPADSPSPSESALPTAAPTETPTGTPAPTAEPTLEPTQKPSEKPTAAPLPTTEPTPTLTPDPTPEPFIPIQDPDNNRWQPLETADVSAYPCPDCHAEHTGVATWKSWDTIDDMDWHYYCNGHNIDFGWADGACGWHTLLDGGTECFNYTTAPAAWYDKETGIWWDYTSDEVFWDDSIGGFNYGKRFPDHCHYTCTECGCKW